MLERVPLPSAPELVGCRVWPATGQIGAITAMSNTSTAPAAATSAPDPRRWTVLVLVTVATAMIMLDLTIVNVALPSIQRDLGFNEASLQWVINAYTLLYGGFLLLGGRAADLLGRRRVLLAGLALFTLASLAAGLSQQAVVLVVARALQGLGGALMAPAALATIAVAFPEGPERNKAVGIWSAVGGLGAVLGVILGGVLVQAFGWPWVFLVVVPVGVPLFVAIWRLAPEGRGVGAQGIDLAGAVTVTSGLLLLVYAVVTASEAGGGALLPFGGAVALLAAFVVVEARARAPLVPLGRLRSRTLAGANVCAMLFQGVFFAQFFFVTLYLQRVLGFSALATGFGLLPLALAGVVSAVLAPQLVQRFGLKPVMALGIVVFGAGLWRYANISADGSYVADVLLPATLLGVGLGPIFIGQTVAAVSGVPKHEAGLASGLLNTSQQVGGAVGLAVLAALAFVFTQQALQAGAGEGVALTAGFRAGFWASQVFMALMLVVVLLLLPNARRVVPPAEAESAAQAASRAPTGEPRGGTGREGR